MLKSYFDYFLKKIIAGNNYKDWYDTHYSLKTVSLKNRRLAKELEAACKRSNGVLTYAEYLQVDQFGRNGYHATHKEHGFQHIHTSTIKEIVELCIQNKLEHIVDIGCGNGSLGIEILKEARQRGYTLSWTGIEINEQLHGEIKKRFKTAKLEKSLIEISSSIQHKAKSHGKTLAIFSFSLDSMPPEIFMSSAASVPDTMIGLQIKDNLLTEIALTKEQLQQKGLIMENGIGTDIYKNKFDLRSWNLAKGQRAYIPIASFSLLKECINTYAVAQLLIIDEFRLPSNEKYREHVLVPRILQRFVRDTVDFKNLYENSGKILYYYPLPWNTIVSVLKSLGFQKIQSGKDAYSLKILLGEVQNPVGKIMLCRDIIASQRIKQSPFATITVDKPGSIH